MNTFERQPLTWKPRQILFWWSLFGGLFFAGMLIAFTICLIHPAWKFENDWPPTAREAWVMYAAFGMLLFFHLLVLRFSWVPSLCLAGGRIELRRFRCTQIFRLAEIEQIIWRGPGLAGKRLPPLKWEVELVGGGERLIISMGHWPSKVRREIVQTLRDMPGDPRQAGWDEFESAQKWDELKEAQVRLRQMNFAATSDTRLWRMGLVALLVSLISSAASRSIIQSEVGFGTMNSTRVYLAQVSLIACCGSAVVVLISIWQMIRYQFTKRALLALALAIVGTVVSALAIVNHVTAVVNRIIRS